MIEADRPGGLDVVKLAEFGLKPGPMFAQLKKGEKVVLENGLEIHPDQVSGPKKRGLKIAILGDTKDSTELADGASNNVDQLDLIVHEATMEKANKVKAVDYGHSTPDMAVQVALKAKAKRLCLTHLSPRFKPDDENGDQIILNEAIEEARGHDLRVEVAKDFYEIELK